ncbi:MAG: hypothetical protein DHS20C06_16810 [Hyphobacterium sp.]|nr:MAG: hypothetical protein DHS20C06_16810 [Hyphobacterium sp.]
MILARISKAVREQNWFAVCLEFVIVIAGVVIGFQVNGWAAEQHDRGVERGHLTRIAEDLRDDIEELENNAAPTLMRIAAIHLVLESAGDTDFDQPVIFSDQNLAIPETPDVPEDQRDHLLGNINLARTLFGNRNGFDALMESGGIDLIRDEALREALQDYYTQLGSFSVVQNLVRELRMESMVRGHDAGLAMFGPATLDELVAAVQTHPEFHAALRSNRDWAIIHDLSLESQNNAATTLLAEIEAELGDAP